MVPVTAMQIYIKFNITADKLLKKRYSWTDTILQLLDYIYSEEHTTQPPPSRKPYQIIFGFSYIRIIRS